MRLTVLPFVLLAVALPLRAQVAPPSARDSTFATPALRLTDLIDKETRRSGSMRKTQTRAWNDTLTKLINALITAAPKPPNAAPVARFTIPAGGCKATAICTFDGSSSSDDKAVVGYRWNCGSAPNCNSTGQTASVVYGAAGTYTVSLTVVDADSATNAMARQVTVTALPLPDSVPPVDTTPPPPKPDSGVVSDTSSTPLVAALPSSVPSFTVPTPTRSYRIGASLKTALDTAKAGDELLLSGTYTGNYVVNKGCADGWIMLRSAADDSLLPAPGVRVDTAKHAAAMPVIQTGNSKAGLTVYGCNVRVTGIEISITETAAVRPTGINFGLVWLGDAGKDANDQPGQITLDKVPQRVWLDRVWVHGRDSTSTQRCIAMNSGATIISNSVLTNCHAYGFDAQGIGGWNGPGPYLIENNEISASTENIMFGGGDPAIPNLSPSDITVRRNWVHKERSWHPTMGSATNVWPMKNLLELKNARRVLYENNVLENSFLGGQDCAVVFKSSQASATVSYPFEGTQDITFRWNVVRNAPCGFNLQGYDQSGQLKTDVHTARVTSENNLFDMIGTEGSGRLMQFTHDLADVIVRQTTFTHAATPTPRGAAIVFDYGAGAARRLEWHDNIITAGNPTNGSILYSGGYIGTAAFNKMAGTRWVFVNNALVGFGSLASRMPPGNSFSATVPTTGGVDQAELQRRVAGVVPPPPPPISTKRRTRRAK